ncbi:MAG: hypothetical protein RLZ98_1466 [Pseudomonadota bacterium]
MKTFLAAIAVSFAILAATAPSQAGNGDLYPQEWAMEAFTQGDN